MLVVGGTVVLKDVGIGTYFDHTTKAKAVQLMLRLKLIMRVLVENVQLRWKIFAGRIFLLHWIGPEAAKDATKT